MSELSSHYSKILENASQIDDIYDRGIPVAKISSLMERRDGSSVFDEGEKFSGAEMAGAAEAYITATASPHIQPLLPREQFVNAAGRVLEREVQLPASMNDIDNVSPQVLVWWRKAGEDEGHADIRRISSLSPKEQDDFCSVIENQTLKAVRIIDSATTNKPVIWGSWGHGTPEERMLTGRGRGVPTNAHGHLHVIDFGHKGSASVELNTTLTGTEKLNHYKPWGTLFHEVFQDSMARVISLSINDGVKANILPFSETIMNNDIVGNINNGFTIDFDKPESYAETFKALVNIAGVFDGFYKTVTEIHSAYYMYRSDPEIPEQTRRRLIDEAVDVGFEHDSAERFADFVLAVRPTYTQICEWLIELKSGSENRHEDTARLTRKKASYEQTRERLKGADKNSMGIAALRDTVADPADYRSIGSVWPEHAGATFIIEDYTVEDEGIQVKRLKIIPGVDSTESAPEFVTGRVLQRPKPAGA